MLCYSIRHVKKKRHRHVSMQHMFMHIHMAWQVAQCIYMPYMPHAIHIVTTHIGNTISR